MHFSAQLLSYVHEITSKKRLPLCVFVLGKLVNVLLRNFYYNALGAFFEMLIQRTDGCHDVPWLLTSADSPQHSLFL